MPLSLSTWGSSLAVALSAMQLALAQDYPVKPVRIITSSAGAGNDFAARQIAPELSSALGQQFVIDNRPSGVVPGQVASKAAPDGYTLLLEGNNWIGTLLYEKPPYDVERDFAPISMLTRSPNVLVVHPSLPAKTIKELIALAKTRPGDLNFGSARAGGGSHLSGELFKHMAKLNIVWIRYRGSPQAMAGLLGGEVHMIITDATNVGPYIKAGRLRGIAVTSKEPSRLAPGLPPIAETLPGYEFVGTSGIFAPARTPASVINRLNTEIVRVLRSPELSERFLNLGAEVVPSTPTEFAAKIRSDVAIWSRLIRDLNIRAE